MGSKEIRAGSAYVEIGGRTAGLDKALARAQQQMKGFQQRIQAIGSSLTNVGTRIAAGMSAALAPLALTVKSAADAQELRSKFGAVFGDLAAGAEKWAAETANAVKRSKADLMGSLSTYQSFFVGMGFGKEQSLGLSQTLAQLAVDFASFHNIADDDAMSRFIAAMSGSSEVLDQFGVNIKEAAIAQEMLKRASTGNEEMDKTLARLSILQKSLAGQGAIGDAVKTSGSFTNQMKALRGSVSEASTAIGEALLPALTPIVNRLAAASKWAATWAQQNGPLIASVAKVGVIIAGAGVGIAAVGLSLTAIGAAVGRAAAGLGAVRGILSAMTTPIGIVVTGAAALGAYLATSTQTGRNALSALAGYFGDLRATAGEALGGIRAAMAGGDFQLAAKILWTGLKVTFAEGIKPLKDAWTGFQKFIVDVANETWAGVQAGFDIARSAIVDGWTLTVAELKNVFDGFKTTVLTGLGKVAQGFLTAAGAFAPGKVGKAAEIAVQGLQNVEAAREKDDTDAAVAREKKKNELIEAERKRHLARLEEIATNAQAIKSGNAANADTDLAKTKADLDKLKADLAALVKRSGATAGTGDADRFKDAPAVPNAQDIAAGIAKSASVAGTFSAFGAGAMGPARTLDRIAKATEQTAKAVIDWSRGGGRNTAGVFR